MSRVALSHPNNISQFVIIHDYVCFSIYLIETVIKNPQKQPFNI
jgi:hypothetical protein